MSVCSRRDFLKLGAKLAALMSLSPAVAPDIAKALAQLAAGTTPVVWLQGQSCSGCSVSLLNSDHPDPADLLTGYIALLFHGTLSAATGDLSMKVLNESIAKGGYLLVVEGSVPAGMPKACVVGQEPFTRQLVRAAKQADAVIAVGTCAAHGGIPSSEHNPTGAVSVPQYLKDQGADKPVISIPGCPVHPDWLVGTLVHVLKFGVPSLDALGRPEMFFSTLVHDQCPRFADYEREKFAGTFGEPGCLFKLGCLGPNTHADCSLRMWNAGINFCIKSGAPCIGCTNDNYARDASFAFFRKNEQVKA
jgi:hydrogenase small subunit